MKGKFEKLQRLIEGDHAAALITDELNQYYLTGFRYTDGYVLVTPAKTYLLCDFRYLEAAEKVPGVVAVDTKNNGLKTLVYDLGIKTLYYEDLSMTVATLSRFQDAYPDVSFLPLGNKLLRLREYKEADEIDAIRRAQKITDKAFKHILGYIKPGVKETDVALELEYCMRRLGAESTAFETICVSGASSSLPHGVPQNRKLRKGFLTMDFGAKVEGYCSDMTRTIVIGKADSKMRKLYNTVLEAQLAALDFMKNGVTGKDADKVARDIIDKDYPGAFGHSLGHGVGLFIHEQPGASVRAEQTFTDGHVVTVEPGIYLPGKYGCRIEDMVIFHDGICEDITKSPKTLIEIE